MARECTPNRLSWTRSPKPIPAADLTPTSVSKSAGVSHISSVFYHGKTNDGPKQRRGGAVTTTQTQRTQVTEQQSREVAEAARQQRWDRPSFAKELFLG